MGEGKREQSQLLAFVYIQCVKNLSGGGIVVISFSTLANSPKKLNLPVVMQADINVVTDRRSGKCLSYLNTRTHECQKQQLKHLLACEGKKRTKLYCLHSFIHTVRKIRLLINGLAVDFTFALNNDLILKKVVYR